MGKNRNTVTDPALIERSVMLNLSLSQPSEAQIQETQISQKVWFINYLFMHEPWGCANGAREKNFQ